MIYDWRTDGQPDYFYKWCLALIRPNGHNPMIDEQIDMNSEIASMYVNASICAQMRIHNYIWRIRIFCSFTRFICTFWPILSMHIEMWMTVYVCAFLFTLCPSVGLVLNIVLSQSFSKSFNFYVMSEKREGEQALHSHIICIVTIVTVRGCVCTCFWLCVLTTINFL